MLLLPPHGPRGRLRTTLAVARQPYAATRRWRARYGPTYMTSVMSGRYFVTGEPEVVRDVFRADPADLYPGGAEAMGPLMGLESLFMLAPSEHGKERKLLAPAFNGSRMRTYTDTMRLAAERQLTSLVVGATCNALEVSRSISAEVIVRAVFGIQEEQRVKVYADTIVRWVDLWKPMFILFPATQHEFFGLSPWSRFLRAGRELDRLLLQDITQRRVNPEGQDILSLLLQTRYDDGQPLSDESVLSHLRTLLFAGHETTMIAMAWVLHYLLRDAESYARMRALLEQGMDAIVADAWFDAVINESLRLYPIILGVVRVLGSQTQLGRYVVPAGTNVWVSIAMLHADPELYPDPDRWNPDRFLSRTFKPHEFAPFGGGHRRCLGAAFAMLETKVAVSTLLRHVEFEHIGSKSPGTVRRNLSMAPLGGVRLRVRGRI